MRTVRWVGLLGALLLPLVPACGARTELGDSALAATCPGGVGVRSCAESVAALCAKAGCPLSDVGWDVPRWCSIGAVAESAALVEGNGATFFAVEISSPVATLLYEPQSHDLLFVLGLGQAGQEVCLAGEVPPEAQCKVIRYSGVGLACY